MLPLGHINLIYGQSVLLELMVLVLLLRHYDIYIKEVNKFKEKIKWDLVAGQHFALYQRILNPEKAIVVRTPNSKVTIESDDHTTHVRHLQQDKGSV